MEIAVLGWGSLIWAPGDLPLASDWFEDGPNVPVEFARVSKDGRLTLVVHGTMELPVLWAKLDVASLEEARRELGWREGCVKGSNTTLMSRHIGWWRPGEQSEDPKYSNGHAVSVSSWAKSKALDGVVWTALPPKWDEVNGKFPSKAEAVTYLSERAGKERDDAFVYIRNTPQQIKTPYRAAFENKFSELRAEI